MKWTFYEPGSLPTEAVAAWQTLNEDFAGGHPALDFRFLELLLKYFGNGREMLGLCRKDNSLVAGVLVQPLKLGGWTLFVPGQACLSALVVDRSVDMSVVCGSLMRSLPRYCWILKLPRVDPEFHNSTSFLERNRTEHAEFGTTFGINLDQHFEDYWQSRSKKLRQRIRKVLRALEEQGIRPELRVKTTPSEVQDSVALHGELESRGWKGSAGTAIKAENKQGKFYSEVLTRFAETEGAAMAQLYFDETPVASLLCIGKPNGMLIVLKTAYHPDFSGMQPGRLIDYFFVEYCCEHKRFAAMEMYTRASRADLSWANAERALFDVNVYRFRAAKSILQVTRNLRKKTKA